MSEQPPAKRTRTTENGDDAMQDSRDLIIENLKKESESLRAELTEIRENQANYYSTDGAAMDYRTEIPAHGMNAYHAKERIVQRHELDARPRLNTSSYVNVVAEPEEKEVALLGLEVNIADASVYPASIDIHDQCVNMIAKLWNCPAPKGGGNYCGSGTVGSTEACLLSGLAHKFRWRKWYQAKNGLTKEETMKVIPNIVISSCYQAAWEKLFRYFDVTPRFIVPKFQNKLRIDPAMISDLVDDKTIAVVGILGNHYNGTYDPISLMDEAITKINEEKGLQVGIHVDAASGGFIAPFQDNVPDFDFRLDNVLSISASGHKFGESCCGTGWVVFRQREDLAEHISVTVTYLGGVSDSMTLNFSRPATGPYVQLYKFLRLGIDGYAKKVKNQLKVTANFREHARNMKWGTKPLFEICDGEDEPCLPVFGARINPELKAGFSDFDLQHALGEFHWYVGAYHLSYENFVTDKIDPLCSDEPCESSMFRVVFKSNLTYALSTDLIERFEEVVKHMRSNQVVNNVRRIVFKQLAETRVSKHLNVHNAC